MVRGISRIDRYVVSETVGPVTLGFVVSTSILLIRAFFELAEAIIHRGLPAPTVLKLLGLNLPHIVVITIPMALLFGILVAIGRLAADSELTALRAAGVSLSYLYRGLLAVSLSLAAINTALMLFLLPWGNRTYQSMLVEQLSAGATAVVEPRVFNEILENKTLYVFESLPGSDQWDGVFIADSLPVGQTRFTVADGGNVRIEDQGRRIVVELRGAVEQQLDLGAPTQAKISSNQVLTLADQDPNRGGVHQSRSSQVRELGWSDLARWARDPERPPTARALARVEMHKKFSIPAACLVFGLVALPLGFGQRTAGRSSAFAQSIAVIAVYYVVQNLGEEGAANGKLAPWIAMWLPNVLLLAAGLVLLARRNSDRRGVLAGLAGWLFHPLDRLRRANARRRLEAAARRAAAAASGDAEPGAARPGARFLLRLPHARLLFPDRLDRYILRRFAAVGFIVLAAAVTLYLVVDLTELVRFVLENQIPASIVVEHYQYFSLQIIYTIAPIVVLLTTLITFGLLSRTSEITAAKALGISVYRLAVPIVVAGIVVGAAAALLDFTILPVTNARKAELRRVIKGHDEPAGLRRATRQWFYSQAEDGGGYIYNYLHFNPQRRVLQRFQSFRFDRRHRLTGHLYASELSLQGNTWVLIDGWARELDGPRVVDYRELARATLDLHLGPEFFSTEVKSSEEMNYFELREYVTRITASGQWVPDLATQLHNKIATPVVCVVMVLVALPFAFRFGKQGALYGVGLAILLGIVLQVVIAFFTTFGEAAVLPPWIAAWGPNLIFSLLSLYLFLGVRT